MTTATRSETNAQAKTLAALLTLGADIDGALAYITASFTHRGAYIGAHLAPVHVVATLLGLTGLTETPIAPGRHNTTEWLTVNQGGDIELAWFVDDADIAHAELLALLVRDAVIKAVH